MREGLGMSFPQKTYPIAPELLHHYPAMNEDQKAAIEHGDGPLLIIAGPGSGKTYCLVLRAINLLLLGKATSKDLIICTFTEKAAFELRDRIAAAARKVGYKGDLSDLWVDTIHGLCNRLLIQHRHRTPLGNNYVTLDELTQWLFLFDNFDEIIGVSDQDVYLKRWKTKWTTIEGASAYFNKITEELVDPQRLLRSSDAFINAIGQSYIKYQKVLFENNKVDFAHLQRILYDLLLDKQVEDRVTPRIKYVLVDEYQDTNYIQEQILLKLCRAESNICVVGDEDQSLYRFRGATVRNILEFPLNFPFCPIVKLSTNYRSHKKIVEAYDRWMSSWDWSNDKGPDFRYNKKIEADKKTVHPEYPAIFSIWGKNQADEASRFVSLVEFLKENNVIHDYNQVALLLRSVKYDYSGPYIEALDNRGIPAFCPRARTYFENDEVRLMIACFAVILGYFGQGRGVIRGPSLEELSRYVDSCIMELGNKYAIPHPLAETLQELVAGISNLTPGRSIDIRPADYFYRLLAMEPFTTFVKNENSARNLAILSQLLNTFQNYYHYNFVSYKNKDYLKFHFFNSFLRLLYDGGMNEYEDPEQPFPKGYVQILTIHQSKGLEFPVVAVSSLNSQISTTKDVDRNLHAYYKRPPFEPESRITGFDRMRLHYVAFSRAEKILVLTCPEKPKEYFNTIWQALPQWPYVKKDLLAAQEFKPKERMMIKRSFSFTGDLKLYETCPRQYQFFREYEFTPSRSAVIFFGLLVHQTIEEIHRIVLDGKMRLLDEKLIRELFEKTYSFLSLSDVRPIGEPAKQTAFEQVMNYFRQNQSEMKRVIETEVDVSVEKDDYILMGKVDLLMGGDGKLEILDFKTSPRPIESDSLIEAYQKQLCIYAHILEKRYHKKPDRLLLYWTSEVEKKNAIIEFPYDSRVVQSAGEYFDEVVRKIQGKDFRVITPPERKICSECDMRTFCVNDGLFKSEN